MAQVRKYVRVDVDLRHLTRARVSEDGFGNLTFAITSPSEKSLARIDYEGGSNFPVLRC